MCNLGQETRMIYTAMSAICAIMVKKPSDCKMWEVEVWYMKYYSALGMVQSWARNKSAEVLAYSNKTKWCIPKREIWNLKTSLKKYENYEIYDIWKI